MELNKIFQNKIIVYKIVRISTECDGGSLQIKQKIKRKKSKKPVFPEFKVKVPKKKLTDTTSLLLCVSTAKVVYQIHKQQQKSFKI